MSEADTFAAVLEKYQVDEDLPSVLHSLAYNTFPELPRPVLYSSFPQNPTRHDHAFFSLPYWLLFADGSQFFWARAALSWTRDYTPLSKQSQAYKILAALNPSSAKYFIIPVEALFEYLATAFDPSLYPTRVESTRPNTWQATFSDDSVVVCNSIRGLHASLHLAEYLPQVREVQLSKHS